MILEDHFDFDDPAFGGEFFGPAMMAREPHEVLGRRDDQQALSRSAVDSRSAISSSLRCS